MAKAGSLATLAYRNIITSVDKEFFFWQLFIHAIAFIYIAGYAFSFFLAGRQIPVNEIMVSYPSYIATGMIGFNVMNCCSVVGAIAWNDKRNGMFEQLLLLPFSRTQYLLANIVTIIVLGLISAGIASAASLPILWGQIHMSFFGVLLIIFSVVCGSLFYGGVIMVISSKMKSIEGYGAINNVIFIVSGFLSNAIYPADRLPDVLGWIFRLNPMTYFVDIIRAGFFEQWNSFTTIEIGVVTSISLFVFLLASRSLKVLAT